MKDNLPLFCSEHYGHCDVISVLDGEGWCRVHHRYVPRNWEIRDIMKKQPKYKVKQQYLAGDEKYIGRECIIYHELKNNGERNVTVLFTDTPFWELQSFPISCLKKIKRGIKCAG